MTGSEGLVKEVVVDRAFVEGLRGLLGNRNKR